MFAQRSPIELHERVFLRNFLHDLIGNFPLFAKARKVKLAHFSAVAHVVHQVERIPFAPNESHDFSPASSSV
jgi:hypothetical protein